MFFIVTFLELGCGLKKLRVIEKQLIISLLKAIRKVQLQESGS